MALFTPQEASGATISKCQAKFSDVGQTQHMYYIFAVNDAEGNYYDWKDHDLASGSDQATIKSAIYDKLITMHKKDVNTESTMTDDDIVGSNPG
jgi:hypothetical protein